MDPLLKLLRDNAAHLPSDLASMIGMTEREVVDKIHEYQSNGSILGYHALLNEEQLGVEVVRAVIEVKITPERDGGFNRIAERIAKYSEVSTCYLMSGGYDLLVIIEGRTLHEVATFVAEKLATIQGVLSTATHFMLKPYKEHGVLMERQPDAERLPVSP